MVGTADHFLTGQFKGSAGRLNRGDQIGRTGGRWVGVNDLDGRVHFSPLTNDTGRDENGVEDFVTAIAVDVANINLKMSMARNAVDRARVNLQNTGRGDRIWATANASLERFGSVLADLQAAGYVQMNADSLTWTRDGALQVDRFLPLFFLPEHRDARYT